VYTAAITADSTQSTTFITFNPTSRRIYWTSPVTAGVYTVTVTGTIINNYGNIVATY
jgi:hypothetical protein